MAEERKDSFAETVDTAASAAHTVKGAIKAGKAISSAAKGAAAGGPYGAVAGAVWAGRKHIGKIIAVIIILLLLPVLFILMLPGLIFGGLINAFSPADTEQPVLNSETAIVENANDITFTINSILGEALDDVMARIEADFASSGADQMEVKNPYSSGPVYNANLIISQYCAARDEDFESISLDDLAAVLRENKENLYSYTSARESREVTSEDPETGEETTTTEIWMVYTIRYNGESYLADHVFALTDEQSISISSTSVMPASPTAPIISAAMGAALPPCPLWCPPSRTKLWTRWRWPSGPTKMGTGARTAAPITH